MVTRERAATQNSPRTSLAEADVAALSRTVRGHISQPEDPDYDQARRVWNSMIDKRPAVIARCAGTADVAAAVNWARTRDLPVAVRGGGHNVAGNAVNDGGFVIDLSRMKGIHVDPHKRTARAQAGVTWGDLDHETQAFGLATPGGEVSMTGIAGYTLSGGMGLLQRKWGMACDNVLSAEVVLASGEVVAANAMEHPDLYWAIRGGGGNFGIVTSFEFALYPLGPEVFSAAVLYPFADAARIMRSWRDFASVAPDEVTSQMLFWSLPPLPDLPADMHGAPIVVAAGLYAGSASEGERALQPLREWGEPIVDFSGVTTYVDAQSSFDEFFPETQRYYWKSLFLDTLDDATIDDLVATLGDRPSPQTLIALRHFGGAVGRVPTEATAYPHRGALYNLSIDGTWDDPAADERIIVWVRQAWRALHDRTGGGVYLNFAGLGEENDELARAGYGENYDRLRRIKAKYDPDNLFRGNINIRP